MSKAILFIRVSTEQQTTESQREALTHYAMADGYSMENIIIIEKKESGYKLDESEREGIAELYQAMESPDVSDVYIWELSRLSRRPKDLYSIREKFLERKIQLHCQEPAFSLLNKERTNYDSNANILFSLFGAMAEQEVIEKKARFARGKKRLAEQGKYNGGTVPYGYKVDAEQDNLIVIDEEVEAPIVREIFNLYEQGKSQPAIAKELFERGVKGRAVRSTKAFTISLVHQILTNELLTGKKHLNKGSSYERQYPQIITPEQFERCREIAKANNKRLPKTKYIHYAHGIIKCLSCGRNFLSVGSRGYYRCQDAYNYSKKYDGYYGVPRCENRVCISTNIMDSLLWELTKDYESMFILNTATQELSECKAKAAVLQQKIDAIPMRLADLESKRQRYISAYAEGWDEAKYRISKQNLEDEVRKVRASEALFREQLSHYEMLIEDIQKRLKHDFDLQTNEDLDNYVDYAEKVWNNIAAITDDNERSRLIHKHIEKVTVAYTTFNYKFGIHPEGKDAFAKEIIVYPYLSKSRTFIFIPYNGKGGIMLQKNEGVDDGGGVSGHNENVAAEYTEFPMEYLLRINDEPKKKRRLAAKKKRLALENKAIQELREEGYISMEEMMEASSLSYPTLYKAIKEGKMAGKNLFNKWFVKKTDFDEYRRRYNPQPRPSRTTMNPENDGRNAEQRLLDAIRNENDNG